MARGGYRPGAGRPKLTEAEKAERRSLKVSGKVPAEQDAALMTSEAAPPEGEQAALLPEELAAATPLDYMLMVMRSRHADVSRRDRMAIAAAPFMHPRKEPVGEGKRDKAASDAKAVVEKSKFAACPPPRLAATGGRKA